MKTSSLDILERSALPTPQAHAILKVLEQEIASSQEMLATRTDFVALQAAIQGDISTLRVEMRAFRAEVATKAEMNAIEGRLSRMVLNCFLGGIGLLVGAVYFLYAHPGK